MNNNDLKQISAAVYHNGKISYPKNSRVLEQFKNKQSGFYSEAIYINGEIVIVYRGTDRDKGITEHGLDLYSDSNMLFKSFPDQAKDAREIYKYVKKKYGNYKINLAGHSLGGSLAQIVGSETGENTVTFNALGTKDFTKESLGNCENITNFGNPKDTVFTFNLEQHRGKVLFTDEPAENAPFKKIPQRLSKENDLSRNHGIEEMGDIDKAVEYKGSSTENHTKTLSGNLESKKPAVLYASVSKDYYKTPANEKAVGALKMNAKADTAKSIREKGNLSGLAASADEDFKADSPQAQPESLRENLLRKREESMDFFHSRLAEDPAKTAEREAKHVSLKELQAPQEARKQRVVEAIEGDVKFNEEKNISGYQNKKRNDNKIFTKEEIDSMSVDEKQKNRDAIFYQKQNIGIPTDEQAKKAASSSSGGMVFVKGYTRADGVQVKSYYRSR